MQERGSKISLFRGSRREKKEKKEPQRNIGDGHSSLGRRKRQSIRRRSEGKGGGPLEADLAQQEHSDVANKSAEMFS